MPGRTRKQIELRRVAHKSTGGTLHSIPEPVGPVGVCRRGTEGVQEELNRDVKLRKR
jgi:hypothetical protein